LFGLTGRITLRVLDVDDDAPVGPEVDILYINGTEVGTLSGADNQWSINTFEFPLELLRLPTTTNAEGRNDFEVDIDTTLNGWAVEIDWAELRLIEDFVPLGLVHGWEPGERLADVRTYFDVNTTLNADEIVAPLHTTTNLESGAEEIHPSIKVLMADTGAHHVNVIAHSYGGLVARLYAWDNPSAVDRLVLVGTPNGGSELADAACLVNDAGPWGSIVWAGQLFDDQFGVCGGPDDALFQLQTDYVRNVFNANVRDRNGTEYWVLSGALPDEDRFLGLDFFPGADDGVVTLDSSQYLLIGRPDHPGKHRILGTLPLEHGMLIEEGSDAMPLSACELYGEHCAAHSAAMLQAQATSATDQVIGDFGGVQVPAGGTAAIDLQFEGAEKATVVVVSDHLGTITPTLAGASFGSATLFETEVLAAALTTPPDGQLEITNTGTELASVVALVGVPVGRDVAVAASPDLVAPNSPVQISVSLTEAGTAETMTAEVQSPSGAIVPVSLAQSGIGTWDGSFTPSEAGIHTVAAWVEGNRPRFDSTLFSVTSGQAQLTGAFAERLDGAEDGLADALVAAPEVTTATAGAYRLSADLADASGAIIASAGTATNLTAGSSSVELAFPGRSIFDSGTSGPYHIVNVVLSRDEPGMALEDQVDELGSTAPYDYRSFDHFPIAFDLDGFVDEGVDANGDGVFEELRVHGSVTVESSATYAVNARLLAPDRMELVEFQTTMSMSVGSNPFTLVFDGQQIGNSGKDGPYTVADLSVYPLTSADTLGYLVTAHQTAAYTAVEFGAVTALPSGRVSVSSDGLEGNAASGASKPSAISDDGRYVAFVSDASNLAAGDTNGASDVFVHDRQTGETTRVSVASDGSQANALSASPAISGDGRFVSFASSASNLVAGDSNGQADVFVYDRQTGATTRVSVTSGGAQANGASGSSSLSDDGRYVAFASSASNLVSGDTNKKEDVFVHDRQTGATTRVSVTSAGAQAGGASADPAISDDGRYVAFASDAKDLVASDGNRKADIFVHDRQTGATTRVSLLSSGQEANAGSEQPAISGDGRYVAFVSFGTNLVPNDTNQAGDVFVHDRQTGETTRVSVTPDGGNPDDRAFNPSISDDGRYVGFASKATNLVAGNPNNLYDAYVRDRQEAVTLRVSIADDGSRGNSHSGQGSVEVSGNGRHVVFDSVASNLVPDDTNGVSDVFVRADFGGG
jgi:Tol biopolymer transport system component/pimeloyl-ACP methyl ester carboxylesterase